MPKSTIFYNRERSQISQKVRVLELRVVLSAYINIKHAHCGHIKLKLTLYDLQKLKYCISLFAHGRKNGHGHFGVFTGYENYAPSLKPFTRVCYNIFR